MHIAKISHFLSGTDLSLLMSVEIFILLAKSTFKIFLLTVKYSKGLRKITA